jgi:dipeptidyl aminopeptidase/acylaminoacyl peptidase
VEFIDGDRIAVWGHGYGGHLATRLLAEDQDRQITCAIAVAPITKWQIHGNVEAAYCDHFRTG